MIYFQYPPLFTIDMKSNPNGSNNYTFGGLSYEIIVQITAHYFNLV